MDLLPAVCFLSCVPVLYVTGVSLALPAGKKHHVIHYIYFPFSGGARTLAFLCITLIFWLSSALVGLPVLFSRRLEAPLVHETTFELLAAASTVGAVFSILFFLKSLLVFDPTKPVKLMSGLWLGREMIAWDVKRLPSKFSASYVVAGMGLVWAMLGGALLVACEQINDFTSRLVYFVMAGACFTIGTFTTYGLGGYLRHSCRISKKKSDNSYTGWRFWQPFQGGLAFVAAQASGWMLFSSALVSILWLICQAAYGVASCIRYWTVAAGTGMLVAELLLAGSLSLFKGPAAVEELTKQSTITAIRDFAVISSLYIPMHIFCACVGISFKLLPASYAGSLWAGFLFIYYMLTSFGEPEHTGRREWPAAQEWFGMALESALPTWLGSLEVVKDSDVAFDPKQRYIFGYIHHGLYPLGAGYLHNLPSFRSLFPGMQFCSLSASVINVVLIIRDIAQWLGVRVVKRRTFVRALREGRAVMLVPGGQAEMVLTYRMFRKQPEYAVYTRHKGFVRVAIEEGANLVPLVVFGEINSLGNLIDWPAMQRWSYKRLGFPIPFLIAGKWGVLPLPAKTGLKFVVGSPIPAPKLEPNQSFPTPKQVDDLHAQFYKAAEVLWHKHKQSFPGYENVTLVME